LILKKDLSIEFRQKGLFFAMLTFAVIVQVVLSIALNADLRGVGEIAAGVLWLPILFAATLGFNRYMAHEQSNRGWHGLMMAPIDRGAIYFGKMLGNLLLVFVVEAFSVFLYFILFNQPWPSGAHGMVLIGVLFLGTWGFIALGSFLTVVAASSPINELLLPILLFPLAIPLIIAMIQITSWAIIPDYSASLLLWGTLAVGYDLVFTLLPIMLFELVMEV
jgi:heme exporter protein B